MDLTEVKCKELNSTLTGALTRQDWSICKNILEKLKGADASNKLKAR